MGRNKIMNKMNEGRAASIFQVNQRTDMIPVTPEIAKANERCTLFRRIDRSERRGPCGPAPGTIALPNPTGETQAKCNVGEMDCSQLLEKSGRVRHPHALGKDASKAGD
jgi:hypothetical protein